MITIIALYALLAATFIFAKKVLMYAPPFFVLGIRMILGGGVLLAYTFFRSQAKRSIHLRDLPLFLSTMFFHIYLTYTLEFWALQYVSALKTTIIFSATPFIAAVLSYFLENERLSKKKICGIAVGLCGLIPTLLEQAGTTEAQFEICKISLPEIALFIAVASATYAWYIIKKLMQRGYGTSLINGFAMLVGGILSFAMAILFENLSNPITNMSPFIGWLALLIITSNVIVYNMYAWLLTRYSMTFVTLVGFLCPSFAALYDWLFITGIFNYNAAISIVFIMAGLLIFYQEEIMKKTSTIA